MEIPISDLVKRLTSNRTNLVMATLAVLIIVFGGYAITGYIVDDRVDSGDDVEITTFSDTGGEICLEDGKPVIRMFSTTTCPHCSWVKDTFDSVVKEYADKGLIVARHWELNIRDDTLTPRREGVVPNEDLMEFSRISNGGVPAFSMGCRYLRLGTGHESTGGLEAEADEFRAVIDKLISESA
jgi:thiol-disulfide isomerase/thioredoxin